VVNGQAYDPITEYCRPDVKMHRPGGDVVDGRDAYADHYRVLHDAFPDLTAEVTDLVAGSTQVATRFIVTGTHKGELLDHPPTGTVVRFPAQVLFRLSDGTIREEFHQSDRARLSRQLSGN
jgi:predicted ester cyclase